MGEWTYRTLRTHLRGLSGPKAHHQGFRIVVWQGGGDQPPDLMFTRIYAKIVVGSQVAIETWAPQCSVLRSRSSGGTRCILAQDAAHRISLECESCPIK